MRLIDTKKLLDSLRGNVLVDVTPDLEKAIEEQPTAIKWIPVEERLPEREEWMGIKSKEHYLRRMEIAVDSDTIEYFLVFYDGYKWFDKFGRTYANVVAWKIHEPFKPLN